MEGIIGEAMSIGPDVDSISIAAGAFGTFTAAAFIFMVMQMVKGFAPTLNGKWAEGVVILVSLLATVLALVAADSNWSATSTWVALAVVTPALAVTARGYYAQLFKVSTPVRRRSPVKAATPEPPKPVKAGIK